MASCSPSCSSSLGTHPIGCSCRGHLNFRQDPPFLFSQATQRKVSSSFTLSVCHTRPLSCHSITIALSTCHRRRCTTFTSSKSIRSPREAHSLRPLSSSPRPSFQHKVACLPRAERRRGLSKQGNVSHKRANSKQRDPLITHRPSHIHQRIHRCQTHSLGLG